ncbi:uncharacterized protein LOC115212154 [Octopus sinensis]|uniref:Uncharacterized protein LOC115212154 n=1 Tax=Octopus sinensis TaxID=2607531 RepID=A0A6P7SEL5_9MOLL|nr:uncharacterized protein LOC115212154 [Octopus sinensis]
MSHNAQTNKIKNDKIQHWHIELSSYSYHVVCRTGTENLTADALSHAFCYASTLGSSDRLKEIYSPLCHPGILRMFHFVKSKNLLFCINAVMQMTANCNVCCELKSFYKHFDSYLIKATQPFERLSVDFSGPLPSNSYKYLLAAIDEYSHFPFAFPSPNKCFSCQNMFL